MKRSRDRGDAPLLFDLPLDDKTSKPPAEAAETEDALETPEEGAMDGGASEELEAESLPLFPEPADEASEDGASLAAAELRQDTLAPPATLGKRFLAAVIDLAVWLAALLLLALGATLLGVTPSVRDWPAALLFLAAFSFLYTVVPLAFWGKTPGMAWAGIVAHSGDGEPLTFGQTGVRWLATLVTFALLGLPALLALLPGGSLVDRWSRSHTDQG